MASSLSRLPSRFPVGTKFVIEGRCGIEGQLQVYSRHIEFPDGTFIPLPARPTSENPRRPPAVRAARAAAAALAEAA